MAQTKPLTTPDGFNCPSWLLPVVIVSAIFAIGVFFWLPDPDDMIAPPRVEPTVVGRASDSQLNQNVLSTSMSDDDIAWHAVNTYGWDCDTLIDIDRTLRPDHFFMVTCASGQRLRVYPRDNQHPKITNRFGKMDSDPL